MEITEILYVTTREEWRDWLANHFESSPEIWLITYRKHTRRASLAYNTAVEEALCFGWVDSLRKNLDNERLVQRFSPRKPGSSFSQTNKERLARLISQGKVILPVLESLGDVRPDDYAIPEDILTALRSNEDAWSFFLSTSPSYQRIRAAYVDTTRNRPGEFKKRLDHLVQMSARRKQFGYGIEEYY